MADGRIRVAITGIGALTPIGFGVSGLWDGILQGRSGISGITSLTLPPLGRKSRAR